ncbi:MAG TPA: c-type cytochrome [Acetobacteraceae bacterium]|nr:c-type cytochrome [Acetobacteraceae bacterium]
MRRAYLIALVAGSVGFSGAAWGAGDVAAGKEKSAACAMCHGPDGQGTQMAPKLAGADPAKFVQALEDYKSGKRDNAMMKAQVAALSTDDEANLAAYYASLK